MNQSWWRRDGDDLVLNLRVQPRATPEGLAEPVGDAVKLRIKAPPVDGKANDRVIALLAKLFGVGRRQVRIESGHTSRNKRVRILAPNKLPDPLRPD